MVTAKRAIESMSLAMLSLAQEDDRCQELYDDLQNINSFDGVDKTLINFLKNPWILKSKKIEEILSLKKCFNYDKTTNLIAMVVKTNIVYLFSKIINTTLKLLEEVLGIVTLKIYGAFSLNNQQINQIKNAIINSKNLLPKNFKSLKTEFILDSNLIGGIKVSINSMVIDNSMIVKLNSTRSINSKLNFSNKDKGE